MAFRLLPFLLEEASTAMEAEQGFRAPSFPAVMDLSSLHRLYIYGISFVLLQLENFSATQYTVTGLKETCKVFKSVFS